MGIYEQGTSNGDTEPVIGHPVYPPPVAFTQPLPGHMQAQMGMAPAVVGAEEGEWATEVCGCCSDCDLCCQTCWCPCVTFGQIADIVDEGHSPCCVQATVYGLLCTIGIPCVYSFLWRGKMRRRFQLKKGCCGDFCVHCCCEGCALCQEHRELRSRGLDPSLGWQVVQQQQYVRPMAAPSPPGVMLR